MQLRYQYPFPHDFLSNYESYKEIRYFSLKLFQSPMISISHKIQKLVRNKCVITHQVLLKLNTKKPRNEFKKFPSKKKVISKENL